MNTAPKKIVVPKEDMERINENIKKFMLMGVPKEEIDKYFYECIKAREER